jgi:diguanylate cyclase (GGDEF)-like protein
VSDGRSAPTGVIARTRASVWRRIAGSGLWGLPRPALLVVLGVDLAYLVLLIVGAVTTTVTATELLTFALLVGCGAASIEGSLRLVWRSPQAGGATNDLLAVWTIPAALLLPPIYSGLVVVPLALFVQLRLFRRSLLKLCYSAASAGTAGFLAAWAHSVLVAHPDGWQVDTLVGSAHALAATAVCVVLRGGINMALVAGVVAASRPGVRLRDMFADAEVWGVTAAEACTGVLVAVACAAAPYAVLLAIPPVLVLQRALLVASLREAARTDAKTGLANSTYWREVADREIARARSGREQVAVLLVDIDHFKAVNDRFGHLVGDDVLRAVAHGLTHGLRPRDFVGRFGGEEFVVLLAGSDLDQARHTAERIRAHVANLVIEPPVRTDPVRVTISVGVAAFRQSGHSINELLDAADSALYAAKDAGRNCVRVAEGARQQVLDLTSDPVIDLRAGGVTVRRSTAD